jgi:hypothetical protein
MTDMNTRGRLLLTTLSISLAVLATGSRAEEKKLPDAPPPPASPAAEDNSSARWNDIKGLTFDQRAEFATGYKRLEARVDEQISELTARRAAMKSTTDTKDWDFAMKALASARSYLKGMGEESTKATPENWDQSKDRVGRAWVQTQEAYAKVKASTTN